MSTLRNANSWKENEAKIFPLKILLGVKNMLYLNFNRHCLTGFLLFYCQEMYLADELIMAVKENFLFVYCFFEVHLMQHGCQINKKMDGVSSTALLIPDKIMLKEDPVINHGLVVTLE